MPDPCSVCQESLDGPIIAAFGRKLHGDCFVCHQCLMPFPEGKFFEADEKLYCEADYQVLFGNRCARCGETIKDRCITALDMKWHPDHFTCDECGEALTGSSFIKRKGRPFCKPCVAKIKAREDEMNKSMCQRCKKQIVGEPLILKKQKYHPHHFSCTMCRKELDYNCKELEGKLYCGPCHTKALSATCAACRRPIEGRSITALGNHYHPEHFVCAKCEKPFAGSQFFEYEGKPYCEVHYNELTGSSCGRCGRPSTGRVVHAMDRQFCETHFICIGCEQHIQSLGFKYFDWDKKPVCMDCYGKLPNDLRKKLGKYADLERKLVK